MWRVAKKRARYDLSLSLFSRFRPHVPVRPTDEQALEEAMLEGSQEHGLARQRQSVAPAALEHEAPRAVGDLADLGGRQ